MNYDQWWKTLEHLIADFRKRKVVIPAKTMNALKSARTMIKVYSADTSRFEPIPAIETYLLDVESVLLNMAKQELGANAVGAWLKELHKARTSESEAGSPASLLMPNLPKGEHWIRIQPSHDIPEKDVAELVSELRLSSKLQTDGRFLIYGPEEAVKKLVKRIARKVQETREI